MNDEQFLNGRLPVVAIDTYENACLVQFCGQLPWSFSTLISIFPTIEGIVKASGKNLAQCTSQMLDQKNTHPACAHCSYRGSSLMVMGWQRTVGVPCLMSS